MPRRNLLFLFAAVFAAILCYQKVQNNPDGQILASSLELIDHLALDPIDSEDLFEGAMEGMVNRLDEYSSYIPPKDLTEFEEVIDKQFGGVGMEIAVDPQDRQLIVVCPLFGTPAHEAGVRAGDKILRIAENSTQGMSVQDAVALLRGNPGDPVNITVLHPGESKPVDLKLVRAVINGDTVLGDTRNADGTWNYFIAGKDRIGYVRIESFADKTGSDLKHVLQNLAEKDMQGLILDLRDNPGGLLSSAEEICDLFIESGMIVSTRGRDGHILEACQASGKGPFTKVPMVVLVNQFSASASEIVSACLQDHHRAAIVGQRTWGKGTVQQVLDLDEEHGALRLTMASYWRPSNQNIHRHRDAKESDNWGVRPDPDCEVRIEGDELTRLHLWRAHRDMSNELNGASKADEDKNFVDLQLAKAIEMLEWQK